MGNAIPCLNGAFPKCHTKTVWIVLKFVPRRESATTTK